MAPYRSFVLLSVALLYSFSGKSQRMLTDMLDTTTALGRGYYSVFKRYDQLRFSGYAQPQFQWAENKGAKVPTSGDFQPEANNRFTLRRGRVRVDYVVRREKDQQPVTQFVFQFDATERGVFARDIWGRYFGQRHHLLSYTAGLFARPFGYEVNLSSSEREAPERGRASQILMRTERDMGAMISFEPRGEKLKKWNWLRFDAGVFNGQGLISSADYDSYKDFIGRLYARPSRSLYNGMYLSGGISYLHGAIHNAGNRLFRMEGTGSDARMIADSPAIPLARRRYGGADVQWRITGARKLTTEFRAEYIRGLQTGTPTASETPTAILAANGTPIPLATRPFSAAYFHFLQNIHSPRHQLVLKYDWYDPNTRVSGTDLNAAKGLSAADVRYHTLGGGYVWYASPHLKATLWYDHVRNEKTQLPGFTEDLADDVFTARLQYRF